jgi:ABC-type transport system substrate-binding protein
MDSAELTSQRPQTITYRIRRDAIWSDGAPISAADFTYLWRHSNGADKRIDVAATTGYRDIRSVVGSKDGKTVTVVFARPFAEWRSLFFDLLPSHYVRRQPGGWNRGLDRNPQQIPSGGPFRIVRYAKGQSLTLERNPRYWGPPAHLDRIVFRFLPDAAQADALGNGEVDVIDPRPQLDLVRTVQHFPGVRSQLRFGLSFEHLTFNLGNSILDDLAVRRAIALAIDRQQLVERTVGQFSSGAHVLGNRIWLTGQPAYQDHADGYGHGDIAAASRQLQQAGWTKGADGVWAKGSQELRLRFSTIAEDRLRVQLGLLLQDQLRKAGIALEIHNARFAELLRTGCRRATSIWSSSPGSAPPSPSQPTATSTSPGVAATTADSPTLRSTGCSSGRRASWTRSGRRRSPTRSTGGCGSDCPASRSSNDQRSSPGVTRSATWQTTTPSRDHSGTPKSGPTPPSESTPTPSRSALPSRPPIAKFVH